MMRGDWRQEIGDGSKVSVDSINLKMQQHHSSTSETGIRVSRTVCRSMANTCETTMDESGISHLPIRIQRKITMRNLKIKGFKLPGFTILEQIIVLALTTIIVLIGFTAVLNFKQLIANVRDNAQKDRSVYLLQLALENDFRDAESIGWDDGLSLEKTTGTVRYEFENSYVIRQTTEVTDTFHLAASEVTLSKVEGNEALVETIAFNLTDQIQTYKMSFFKEYPDYKIREEMEDGN